MIKIIKRKKESKQEEAKIAEDIHNRWFERMANSRTLFAPIDIDDAIARRDFELDRTYRICLASIQARQCGKTSFTRFPGLMTTSF